MTTYCPVCGTEGVSRERRPNGNDSCRKGHKYPSAAALSEPQVRYTALNHIPRAQQPYAVMYADAWVVGVQAAAISKKIVAPAQAESLRGPIAFCVSDHSRAEGLAGLLGQHDQGVVVIPYAASALAYCGGGTMLFRGIVAAPPPGALGSDHAAFMSWLDRSILPFAEPNAPRIIL